MYCKLLRTFNSINVFLNTLCSKSVLINIMMGPGSGVQMAGTGVRSGRHGGGGVESGRRGRKEDRE